MILSCDVHQHLPEAKEYVVADATPTASEMADSGLETGSISPHENTTSENSSTDLEITHAAEYISTNDEDSDRLKSERVRNKESSRKKHVTDDKRNKSLNNGDYRRNGVTQSESSGHSATYSSLETEHQPTDSSENIEKTRLNADEIFQYESQVLSEPFYESDCGSDENESFEFVEPVFPTSGDHEQASTKNTSERKIQSNAEESRSTTIETEFDRPRPADASDHNSSSTSGYYFIDASTLNDEVIDIVSTNVTKNQYGNAAKSSSFAFSSDYTANNKSNNTTDEQSCKFTPLKTPTLQTGHERVAEFERELKLTEYLQPVPESRKIKRVDSTSEEKTVDATRPADKESLTVEIKEADSGESAHPSPCPDNNTKISNDRDAKTDGASSNVEATVRNENEGNTNANEDRRPSLIRRNTFELDSNDEKLSVLRQEYERRQGSLVFQSAIPQYSGHRVDGDSLCHIPSDPVVPTVSEPSSITFTPNVQIATNTQYPVSYLLLDNCKYGIDRTQTQGGYLQSNLNRSCTLYPVTKSASDKSIIDYGTDPDDASNRCSSSLPVTLNSILEKDNNRMDSMKRTKRDEATPIISGGVSTSDYSKPTDSPIVRRKTESTPIVSGGSVIMNKPEIKPRPSKMSSSMTAWVVDMSDCNKGESRCRSNSRGMSQSFSSSECVKKSAQKSSNQEKHHDSLGFFVNLKDVHDVEPVERERSSETRKERDGNSSKSYCEFYVDISNESNGAKAKSSEKQNMSVKNASNEGEKKNIFSMFIDLNDTCEASCKEPVTAPTHRRSFSTVPNKLADTSRTDDSSSRDNSSATGDNQSSQEQKKEKTKPNPVFMFIESDSPVVRRRTLSTSRPTFKRHSWNMDKTQPGNNGNSNGCVAKELMFRREHKRAHSISMDNRGDSGRSQAKNSSSSHSLSEAAKAESYDHKNSRTLLQERESNCNNMDTSSEDVFDFDVRDTPPNSHVEIDNGELRASVANRREYKEIITDQTEMSEPKVYEDEFSETSAWEKTCTESTEGQTRKSETFDISSGSGPSPDSDNQDYELTDLLNGEVPRVNDRSQITTAGSSSKISETRKSLNETIKKIECELKAPEYNNKVGQTSRSSKDDKMSSRKNLHLDTDKTGCSSFVRLSDLDKTPIINHASDVLTVQDERSTYRMSSSIPETSWIESKLAMTRNSGPVRPVSRKLASVMSTSLPSKQKSPLEDVNGDGEGEGIISESDLSSMQSSMGRSGAGT